MLLHVSQASAQPVRPGGTLSHAAPRHGCVGDAVTPGGPAAGRGVGRAAPPAGRPRSPFSHCLPPSKAWAKPLFFANNNRSTCLDSGLRNADTQINVHRMRWKMNFLALLGRKETVDYCALEDLFLLANRDKAAGEKQKSNWLCHASLLSLFL